METDIRQTPLYREIEEHFRRIYEPAFGQISGAASPDPKPDGQSVAFTGSRIDKLEGAPSTRICLVDTGSRRLEEITGGPNDDRLPRWSPDGSRLAFLSDRAKKGRFQLYLLERGRLGDARPTPPVDGTVEYLQWSPDGGSILLGVAGLGADVAGAEGSGTTAADEEALPSWMPSVESGAGEHRWRHLSIYDVSSGHARLLSPEGLNVWEAAWAGSDQIAAIVSDDPNEDAWYTARLALIDARSGAERPIYRSAWQLAHPAASPDGRHLAVVEGLSSDRGVLAGDLLLLNPGSGETSRIDTHGVDVAHLAWRDEDRLLFAGVRNLHSVVGEYEARSGQVRELWDSPEWSGTTYPEAVPFGDDAFVAVVESYRRYPELAVVRNGSVDPLTSFSHPGAEYLRSAAGAIDEVSWEAPDGLEIQGLLITPSQPGPHPLIVNVHGGPVSVARNRWLGASLVPLLVSRGYAVLQPNPRGSTGRGQAFARLVVADVGGAETGDHLSGVDAMVECGLADPERIGVTGGSHGGFMTSWIITQSDRFAAAVAAHPVTDFLSQHLTSNIGAFDRWFLQDDPSNPRGRYFSRSPVMFAKNARTPTLVIAGGRDRCTPPGQASELYRALQEHGVESALVVYPEEGHGVRKLPALIDYCTRAIDWFERHMPPEPRPAQDRKENLIHSPA